MKKNQFRKTSKIQPPPQTSSHATELLRAEECERQRLAQILHDGLQPILVGVKLHLVALQRASASRKIKKALTRADEMLTQSIDLTRSLSIELSPPILDEVGALQN